jgi:hypothetical protein
MYQNFIIPYLYEAQHVLGDTPPIIRSLKLHWQPLVLHTRKVVERVVAGSFQLTTSINYMSKAPDDGRRVARKMVSFI